MEFAPQIANLSVRCKKEFLLIQPPTKIRMDFGIKLTGVAQTDRLEESTPFGTMCTHRGRTESNEQIDDQLFTWIRAA